MEVGRGGQRLGEETGSWVQMEGPDGRRAGRVSTGGQGVDTEEKMPGRGQRRPRPTGQVGRWGQREMG